MIKTGGLVPGAALLVWRVGVWLRIPDGTEQAIDTGSEVVVYLEETREGIWAFKSWLQSLPWDWLIPVGMILFGLLVHLLTRTPREPEGLVGTDVDESSSAGSDPGTDSDPDEEDARQAAALKKEMEEMKAQMARELAELREFRERDAKKKEDEQQAKEIQDQKMQLTDLIKRLRLQEESVKRDAFRKRLENGEENTGTPRGLKASSGAASGLIQEIKKTMVDG